MTNHKTAHTQKTRQRNTKLDVKLSKMCWINAKSTFRNTSIPIDQQLKLVDAYILHVRAYGFEILGALQI